MNEITDRKQIALIYLKGWFIVDLMSIIPYAEIIAFLSGSTTLRAGTVILTGTPSGVGMAGEPPRFLNPGDEVVVEITGIGSLKNPVQAEV